MSATYYRDGQMLSMQVSYETPWAARCNTWLLIEQMPKGVVISFLFLFCSLTHLQGCILLQQHLDLTWQGATQLEITCNTASLCSKQWQEQRRREQHS